MTVSQVRENLADVLGRANYAGETTYITKRGRRIAAVVPVEVAEAGEAAEDAWLSELARKAEMELAAGAPTRSLQDVMSELGLSVDLPVLPPQRSGSALPTSESLEAVKEDHRAR